MKVTEISKYFRAVLLLVIVVWMLPLRADEVISLEVGSGAELAIEQLGEGRQRILWLPSEYGFRGEAERQLARQLAELGYTVWLADLHSSYFIPWGRSSLDGIPREDIRELIARAQPEGGQLYLFSYGRGAALLLEAARLWQQHEGAARSPLGGGAVSPPQPDGRYR